MSRTRSADPCESRDAQQTWPAQRVTDGVSRTHAAGLVFVTDLDRFYDRYSPSIFVKFHKRRRKAGPMITYINDIFP